MNNTQKDRYENKLVRFLKECDALWDDPDKRQEIRLSLNAYEAAVAKIQKKYGLTEDEVRKAWALKKHKSDRYEWCDTRFHKGEEKQKAWDRREPKDDV